jgi:hypothetical protein
MLTVSGIDVDAYVQVDASCYLSCEVVGEQAQVRFGSPQSTGLTLIFSERSLELLVSGSTDALNAMRAPAST